MAQAVILLGGNEGDSLAILKAAMTAIEVHCGELLKVSSFYESPAWGFEANQAFINQAALIETVLAPETLLHELLKIEQNLGRVRNSRPGYSSRSIDLDILLFEDFVINNSSLQLPHPRLCERKFALIPLNEILPNWVHPLFGASTAELLTQCTDESLVTKLGQF